MRLRLVICEQSQVRNHHHHNLSLSVGNLACPLFLFLSPLPLGVVVVSERDWDRQARTGQGGRRDEGSIRIQSRTQEHQEKEKKKKRKNLFFLSSLWLRCVSNPACVEQIDGNAAHESVASSCVAEWQSVGVSLGVCFFFFNGRTESNRIESKENVN